MKYVLRAWGHLKRGFEVLALGEICFDLSSAVPELWFCSSGGVCVRMRVCSEALYL